MLAVRNKALSVLAGTVRASELVPALLDLDDTELDDTELDDNGRGRGDRRQGAHQDGLSLLWTTCPDLTGRRDREGGQGYGCFGGFSLIADSLVDKADRGSRVPETVGGGR